MSDVRSGALIRSIISVRPILPFAIWLSTPADFPYLELRISVSELSCRTYHEQKRAWTESSYLNIIFSSWGF